MISHRFIPETKGLVVQTRSMASVNPKIGNSPIAIERQLQTLLATVEKLMQQNEALMLQNQVLEIQVEQLREQQLEPNNHQERSNNH